MEASTQTSWRTWRLGDLLKYEQPGRYLVRSTDYSERGKYPVLTAGKTFLLGYTNEPDGAYTAHPVIIFDDFTTASKYVDFDFKAKSSAMKMLTARAGEADLRFMYERMQLIKYPIFDHKRRWIAEFSKIEIEAPEFSEQIAIAEIANDLAAHIAALERLIAKKQAIKQGMMQQLLTGRARLPGYTVEWAPVRLRDAGGTYGGLVGKSKEDFGTGSATFVTFMEVMEGARLRGRGLARVRVRPTERQNRVLRGDVLFNGSSETPEEVALAAVVDYDPTPTTYLNSFCFGYRLKTQNQIDPTYLAHFFRSSQGREIVSVLAQGATRYNIAKTKLMSASPMLPPIDEQRAIVSVLSDVEAEIEGLNVRLDKARAIKTGMMQQLLTGRTRLPVEAVS